MSGRGHHSLTRKHRGGIEQEWRTQAGVSWVGPGGGLAIRPEGVSLRSRRDSPNGEPPEMPPFLAFSGEIVVNS